MLSFSLVSVAVSDAVMVVSALAEMLLVGIAVVAMSSTVLMVKCCDGFVPRENVFSGSMLWRLFIY